MFYYINKFVRVLRYSDKVLGDLLAVKGGLCDRRFEVKVDDVVFAAFPLLLQSGNIQPPSKKQHPTMISFNIAFALQVHFNVLWVQFFHINFPVFTSSRSCCLFLFLKK